MNLASLAGIVAVCAVSLEAQIPAGWKIMRDSSGSCQAAVPSDWSLNKPGAGMATAPDHKEDLALTRETTGVIPMRPPVQKMMNVDRMIENTSERVFWIGKPSSFPRNAPPVVVYHVAVPGRSHNCTGLVSVKQGGSADTAKKIGATVSAVD